MFRTVEWARFRAQSVWSPSNEWSGVAAVPTSGVAENVLDALLPDDAHDAQPLRTSPNGASLIHRRRRRRRRADSCLPVVRRGSHAAVRRGDGVDALTGNRRLLTGDTVPTLGSGGVSLFAMQFAKLFGATVIATTSTEEKSCWAEGARRRYGDQLPAHP
jgi:hypothetical protein